MSLPLPEQTSRNRSASTGDSGLPKHEHKRPRLSESQDLDHTVAMSIDPTHNDPASSHPTSNLVSPPQSPLPQNGTTYATSPRSKVTINTRPLSSQSLSHKAHHSLNGGIMAHAGSKVEATTTSQSPRPSTNPTGQHETISISSSECGSPVIQVAAPEDLDHDPADTQWEPLGEISIPRKLSIRSDHVQQTFPYLDTSEKGQTSLVVTHIAKVLFDGINPRDGVVLLRIKRWLSEFAVNASDLDYSFFAHDKEFWQKVPSLISSLLRRRNDLPRVIHPNDLVELFVAYARITTLLVEADVGRLRSYTEVLDVRPVVVPQSLVYLSHIPNILVLEEFPFHEDVRETQDHDTSKIAERVIIRLLGSQSTRHIQAALDLFRAMATLYTERPSWFEPSINAVFQTGRLINILAEHQKSRTEEDTERSDVLSGLCSASSEFLMSITTILDLAITKQQSWLNIDTCEKLFKVICPFVDHITASFPQLATDIMIAANVKPSAFDDDDLVTLSSVAWKFATLLKCIKKGRMEVRVSCVQIMAQDLVDTYHQCIRSVYQHAEHPKVQFMNLFIRENGLIRYLIGVDSHPQIIDRCVNIIGFLCVSNNYCNDDTEILWQTITESQDPRAVTALLGVFQQNLENLELEILCHISKKLLDLPFARVDGCILDFSIQVMNAVHAKTTREYVAAQLENQVDEYILKFCLKLLREAYRRECISSEISARIRTQIRNVLLHKVRLLQGRLSIGTEGDAMQSMLRELCSDIRAHNDFAAGSISALSALLHESNPQECLRVIEAFDLTAAFVDDTLFASQNAQPGCLTESTWIEFDSRFNLLIILVYRASHTVTDDLLKSLWTGLLSSPEVVPRLRTTAWNALASIFDASNLRNDTLDRIVNNYLPNLSPLLYDEAVLHFVQQSVLYETRHAPIDLMEPRHVVDIPGIERLWNIMLNAPTNTVEQLASDRIIETYLAGPCIAGQELLTIQNTHLALIDRSVNQVINAAGYLRPSSDVNMMDGSPEHLLANEESKADMHAARFNRLLLFLRRFLDAHKLASRNSPAPSDHLKTTLNSFESKGSTLELTLQIIGHKTLRSSQVKWSVGCDNIGADAWQFLSEVTGWSEFTVINGGRRLVLKEDQRSLQDLGVKPGSFMISKVQGSPESIPARSVRASSPVDNKIMHHFDELYSLLELENQYARRVFDFLCMFPTQDQVVQKIRSMVHDSETLLPVSKPFKLMYYARALRSCIEDESFSSDPNADFLTYGIRAILSILPKVDGIVPDENTCISVAQGLFEALVLGFRATVPQSVSCLYIEDPPLFNKTVFDWWLQALDLSESRPNHINVPVVVSAPFQALVEGLLHDERLTASLSRADLSTCLRRSLLTSSNCDVRQAVLKVIHGLTGVSNPKTVEKSKETRTARTRFPPETIERCLEQLWTILVKMVNEADGYAAVCEEYFDAVTSIFQRYQSKIDQADLELFLDKWKTVLLDHVYNHQVGRAPQDFLLSSLGKLLVQLMKALNSRGVILTHENLVQGLFEHFLFPPLSDNLSFDASSILLQAQQQDPVLDMKTRGVLYELVLLSSQDPASLDTACNELNSDLVPKDFYFQPTTSHERQTLRSETGYSGLRNLSNTCYLNSLLSQLFMNLEFRDLVMNVNIIDHSKQKLVSELGKVFAYMQTTYEEAISPETAIDAITLWDGTQIDVTIQMDVDEFFNLLFDRIESQIVDPNVCNSFKSIYGGQLVQQIKSKECEHVSERLEPFSTVQVEIKGKATLEESLRAYVEGEVLQGENQYSCTGCGKHVDAVKRACLKTIPDHLIFNLKRFDFDIMNGMRCKVNDEFGFPESIDMMPYTLEALTKSDEVMNSDVFELVGVIIHSGTAESGHYYSYIRQRPSALCKKDSWVQFNDHSVTMFDHASIKECCFGGMDFGGIQHPKFYNGYMLFYQRSSSIRSFESKYLRKDTIGPVRLPVNPVLTNHINQHNELFLRSYVAQDPTHAKFMKSLLQLKAPNNRARQTDDHEDVTSKLLLVVLDYVNQMSARWKDVPEVEETLYVVRAYASECTECSKFILDWLRKGDNLADNIIRSCYMSVRKAFINLIATCWNKWAAVAYGDYEQLLPPLTTKTSLFEDYVNYVRNFLTDMVESWDLLQRHARSWEGYFGLLTLLLAKGDEEARQMIGVGLLEQAMEFIYVHVPTFTVPKRLKQKYTNYFLGRERNRIYPHGLLIQFLADLLPYVDFAADLTDDEDRTAIDGRVALSKTETVLLAALPSQQLLWMKKIIYGRANPGAADAIVVCLCKSPQYDIPLGTTLREGICERELVNAVACLQPAVAFLNHCSDPQIVVELVDDALASIETTNGQYATDFLRFVQEVSQVDNPALSTLTGGLKSIIKKNIVNWAPVLLMAPNNIHTDVRTDSLVLLNTVLFQDIEDLRDKDIRQYRQDVNTCRRLATACALYAENMFVHARAPNLQGGQAEQSCRVVEHCLPYFGESASDEEEAARIENIMEEFKARAEGVIETVGDTDWNASSDFEAMSEVDNVSEASN